MQISRRSVLAASAAAATGLGAAACGAGGEMDPEEPVDLEADERQNQQKKR
jgi:hypothetical protein